MLLSAVGCGPNVDIGPIGDASAARQKLDVAKDAGPVRAQIFGDPFGLEPARQDVLVTSSIADGITGIDASFTTDRTRVTADEPRLVVVLAPITQPVGRTLCDAPETIRTTSARDELFVAAAFCDGDELISAVNGDAQVDGPADQRFKRLLWQVGGTLFPDNYENSYGINLIPGVNLGIGGSFGF